MIKDINYKIAELLEMNPDYKVLIHTHEPNDFFYNKDKCNTRMILKDTY